MNKHAVIAKQLQEHYRHPAEHSRATISGPRHARCRVFHLVHKNWSRRSGMLISECNRLQITDYCYLSVIPARLLFHHYHHLKDWWSVCIQEQTIIENSHLFFPSSLITSVSFISICHLLSDNRVVSHTCPSSSSSLLFSTSFSFYLSGFQFYPWQTALSFFCRGSSGSHRLFWGCPYQWAASLATLPRAFIHSPLFFKHVMQGY